MRRARLLDRWRAPPPRANILAVLTRRPTIAIPLLAADGAQGSITMLYPAIERFVPPTPPQDTQAPSVPTGLTATAL